MAGKQVLEIGSGCGVCGIVASKLGAAKVGCCWLGWRALMYRHAVLARCAAPRCFLAGTSLFLNDNTGKHMST